MEALIFIALMIAAAGFWYNHWKKKQVNFIDNNPQFKDAKKYSLVLGNEVLINDDGYIALKNRSMPDYAVVHIKDIVDFDIKKDGKFHGSVAGSVSGALLFGATGMVLGTILGGKDKIHELSVAFVVNHEKYQRIEIDFLNSKMKAGGIKDKLTNTILEHMVSQLQVLENNYNQQVTQENNVQQNNAKQQVEDKLDVTDRIQKLHGLKESGAITAEEFVIAKRKILDSM